MEKLRNCGRRLLALALALCMVLSYVPMDIVAVDTEGESGETVSSIKNFTVTLQREEVELPEETTAPADEELDSLGEIAEEPVTEYNYTVTAKIGDEDITAVADDIFWFAGLVETLDTEDPTKGSVDAWSKKAVIENVSDAVVTVVVAYQGMYLRVSNETAERADVTAAWGLVNPLPETIYVGIPVNASVLLNKYSTGAPVGGIKTTVNEAVVDVTEKGLIAKAASAEAVEIFRQTAGDPDAYAELIAAAKIAWPELNARFTIGETVYGNGDSTEWFTEGQTVGIAVTCPEGFDPAYLPQVFVGETAQETAWTEGEEGVFTTSVEVASMAQVVVGGEYLNVNIDASVPVIDGAYAYANGENVVVNFQVSAVSGVKEVTVNGAVATASGDSYSVVTEYAKDIVIRATGNNGLTAEKTVNPQRKLSIEFVTQEIGSDSDAHYVAMNSQIQIKVYGASDAGRYQLNTNAAVVTKSGEAVATTWSYADGVWSAYVEVPVTNLYVKVSDAQGRQAENTLYGTYAPDTTAPVINVTKNQTPSNTVDGVDYYQNEVTFTVIVNDVTSLNAGDLSMFYVLEGAASVPVTFTKVNDRQYVATVTVHNGEKLVSLGVTAKDSSGNAASGVTAGEGISFDGLNYNGNPVEVDTEDPTVEFTVSKNVTQFFVVDGVAYAVIDVPVTDEAADTTEISVTAKAVDKNLVVTAEGWTDNGNGTWTYTKSVKNHETDVFAFSFTVKDKAGRLPAETVKLEAKQNGRTMASSIAVVRDAEGKYTCQFNVDRRYPSSGADNTPPQIVLTAPDGTAKYNGNELFHNSFSFDLFVTDASGNGADSGVASVSWTVSDTTGITLAASPETVAEDGKYTITGTVAEGYEAKDLVLKVSVADKVGNAYTYSKTFHVDNKAPEVTVTKTVNGAFNQTVGNVDYYNGTVTYTFAVTDMFPGVMATVKYTFKDGTTGELSMLDAATKIVVADGQTLTGMTLAATDGLGNVTKVFSCRDAYTAFDESGVYTGNNVHVDGTAPVITVTENVSAFDFSKEGKNVIYHSEPVSYTVVVTDDSLDNGQVTVEYCIEGADPETKNVPIVNGVATETIEVAAGQTLTYFKVSAKDASGVYAKAVAESNVSAYMTAETAENATWLKYTGKYVAVDNDLPKILVEKTGSYIQTIGGRDYYNGEVTYNVTVTDNFLEEGLYTAKVVVTYEDGTEKELDLTFAHNQQAVNAEDKLTASFTVVDAKPVKSFSIQFADVVGKTALMEIKDTDKDAEGNALTHFTSDAGVYTYNGNVIVVDMTAPVVSAQFTVVADNEEQTPIDVEKFYVTADGVFYAYLNPAVDKKGPFDKWISNSYESVLATITFTLTETNPWAAELEAAGWIFNETTAEWTYTKAIQVKKGEISVLEFAIAPIDMAKNVPVADVNITTKATENDGDYAYQMALKADAGAYNGKIYIDRKTADMPSAPAVNLSANQKSYVSTNGIELYNNSFSYTLTVTDNDKNDSGIKSVQWILDDGLGGSFLEDCGETKYNVGESGTYTIPINILEGVKNETDTACLTVIVTDYVGNVFTFVRYFAVDNLGSRVTVLKEVEEGKAYIQDLEKTATDYYNGEVTYFVHVEDQNLDEEKLVIRYTLADGTTTTVDLGTLYSDRNEVYFGTFTVTNDQVLTDITVIAPDVPENGSESAACEDTDKRTSFARAENTNDTWNYTGYDVAVDKDAPVVTITKSGDSYFQTGDDGINYHSGKVEYLVEVEDDFMTAGVAGEQKLILTYTYEDGKTETIALDKAQWTVASKDDADKVKYTHTISVENGQVLTEIKIQAVDNAGNAITVVNVVDSDSDEKDYNALNFTETNGTWIAKPMTAVDTEAAEVTVTKSGAKAQQTFGDYTYHDDKVTFQVEIKDEFLNNFASSEAYIIVTYMDREEKILPLENVSVNATSSAAGVDVYPWSITLEDGDAVVSIDVLVRDNAGNYTKTVTVVDETGTEPAISYTFNEKTNYNEYVGKGTIVDTTAPTAVLTIGGNVKKFYTYNEIVYVELETPAEGLSGIFGAQKSETVTLTLVVKDKNISLDAKSKFPILTNIANDTGAWSGTVTVNADSTVTYYKEITVKPDATGLIEIDLSVFDLAGNPIVADGIELTPINDTIPAAKALKAETEGQIVGTFSVDRRRPSSADQDNKAPEIILTTDAKFTKSSNDRELYADAFEFAVKITDGENNAFNSGIADVSWILEDETGFVVPLDVHNVQENGTYSADFTIPVDVFGIGESNDVILTVTAVDNVGNVTTYVREFAVDNLAPRVTVSYDNNDVRNERYFRADRTATISVEDINFDPSKTTITTEVTPTEWVQDGDTWTCTTSYTVDGVYTFEMTSTDLTGVNTTADADVNYVGAAPQDFVIDKTAPIITVTYNPNVSNGTDERGVHYYDEELDVTVTIREVNFRAADVVANFGARNQLTGWTMGGEMHVASETFTEGNEYSFTINYTDLAGNPAVGYESDVFSVDLDAPTITISRGELTNDELNIVQGELVLSFQINDDESNLKDYTIKVTRLNNNFVEEVVSGADFYSIFGDGDRTTVNIDFAAIEAIKENDGIYTISITAQDYAGQSVSLIPEMVISLNRFGSTFMTDDSYTSNFLNSGVNGQSYNQSVDNKLVIKEINPNRVWADSAKTQEGSSITLSVNGNSIVLKYGVDYTVTVTENGTGDNKWYVYTYEIDPSVFYENGELVDGKYTILLYGEDEAGNVNTNEANAYGNIQVNGNGEYTGKVEFTLDHMAPVIAVTGIEERETYDAAFQRMQITISDSSPTGIDVYLDEVLVEQFDSLVGLTEDNVWVAYDAESGNYVVNITEQTHRQSVRIVATDAAGNSSEYQVNEFLITTKTFVQLINTPVFVGGVGLAGALAIILPILKKKKKKAA